VESNSPGCTCRCFSLLRYLFSLPPLRRSPARALPRWSWPRKVPQSRKRGNPRPTHSERRAGDIDRSRSPSDRYRASPKRPESRSSSSVTGAFTKSIVDASSLRFPGNARGHRRSIPAGVLRIITKEGRRRLGHKTAGSFDPILMILILMTSGPMRRTIGGQRIPRYSPALIPVSRRPSSGGTESPSGERRRRINETPDWPTNSINLARIINLFSGPGESIRGQDG